MKSAAECSFLTHSGEGDSFPPISYSTDLVNLEPDCTIAGPVGHISRRFCHINVHDLNFYSCDLEGRLSETYTLVIDSLVAHNTQLSASRDGDRLSCSISFGIITAEVSTGDVCDLEN